MRIEYVYVVANKDGSFVAHSERPVRNASAGKWESKGSKTDLSASGAKFMAGKEIDWLDAAHPVLIKNHDDN